MEHLNQRNGYLLMLRQCMWLADLPRQALLPAARDVLGWASDAPWPAASVSSCDSSDR